MKLVDGNEASLGTHALVKSFDAWKVKSRSKYFVAVKAFRMTRNKKSHKSSTTTSFEAPNALFENLVNNRKLY